MPLRWHVDLPGPVAYSKPIRRRGKKPGALTRVLAWFIVKPLELTCRGLAALAAGLSRPHHVRPEPARFTLDTREGIGWHHTAWGLLYWSGENWYDPEGRAIF